MTRHLEGPAGRAGERAPLRHPRRRSALGRAAAAVAIAALLVGCGGAGGEPPLAQPTACESAVLGGLGGLVGTALGVMVVIAVALARGWTAVMSPTLTVAAPLIGLAVGSVAGLYPAVRAARIEPTEALRR